MMPRARIPDHAKTRGALRGFFVVADAWGVDRHGESVLLAASLRSIGRWRSDAASAKLNRDQIERISYVLGIYSSLHSIMEESSFADAWVSQPNTDFGDDSPLSRMLAGNVSDLWNVQRYVDAWRLGL